MMGIPWLRHGFSLRAGGTSALPRNSLNLGFTEEDSREAVAANRELFFAAVGANGFALFRLRQTHSEKVVQVTDALAATPPTEGDAAITQTPGIALTVLTADCVPILMADPEARAVAAIHAGWRGTLRQIARKTVEQLQVSFGCAPRNLKIAVGPSIRLCCYEVGREVKEAFQRELDDVDRFFKETDAARGKFHLDLKAANCEQLKSIGVLDENISTSTDCTVCHPEKYFSHRREDGKTGRMMALVAIAP